MAEEVAPSKKRAFLVLGPEASGNRYVTRCFVKAGCYGHGGHSQFLDTSFEYATDKIVWRRSLPYGPAWPDLDRMLLELRDKHNFQDVHVLALMRTHPCIIEAQVRDHGKSKERAERFITKAMRMIASFVLENNLPVRWVTYESMARPEVLRGIFDEWGLDSSKIEPFKDGNAKYFPPHQ